MFGRVDERIPLTTGTVLPHPLVRTGRGLVRTRATIQPPEPRLGVVVVRSCGEGGRMKSIGKKSSSRRCLVLFANAVAARLGAWHGCCRCVGRCDTNNTTRRSLRRLKCQSISRLDWRT